MQAEEEGYRKREGVSIGSTLRARVGEGGRWGAGGHLRLDLRP